MTRLVSIGRDRVFYAFTPELEPAARVEPGDLVIFETQDALGGQVRSEEDTVEKVDFTRVNPATGPLYVEGAGPGDAVVVEVLSIETSSQGFVVTAPGAGVLGEYVKASRTRSCRVVDDYVEVLGFRIPAWKMIGVVGVASPERPSTGVPGRHGGNLDTKYTTVGAKVYLPVFYEGGLLGVGDLHAVMGHGEVCVAACEVSGSVLVRVGVVKGYSPRWPLVEYGDSTFILTSAVNIEEAIVEAAREATNVLSRALGLDWVDAYILASLGIDIGVSQLVDPKKTAWARIPKSLVSTKEVLRALSEQ